MVIDSSHQGAQKCGQPSSLTMGKDISELSSKIEQLTAEVALLKARKGTQPSTNSPWLSLQEAATILKFSSHRALRNRIKSGKFPPECYRELPTKSGKRSNFIINVDRYIKLLN